MKKIFVPLIMVAVVAAIFFPGCMPGAAPVTPPPVTPPPVTPPPVTPPPVTPPPVTPPPAPAALKVVVVTGGSRTDGAWSQSHYESYLKLQETYPQHEYTFIDLVEYPDMYAVLSTAAKQNNLVLVDTTFYEPMMTVPGEEPDTWFAIWCPWMGEMVDDFPFPNVVGYEQRDEDGGFLAGVTAALMTKTKKVGYVAGQAYPEIIRYGYGFKKGLEYIDPEIELLVLYTGSWVDIEKAYESAKAIIGLGGDVIAHYSDAGGHGVAKAVKETPDCWFIGEVLPEAQAALCPDRILTTFIVHHDKFCQHAVETLMDGTIHRELYSFGVMPGLYEVEQRGWPVIAPLTNVPPEVEAKVAEVEHLIRTGKVFVPFTCNEDDLRPLY